MKLYMFRTVPLSIISSLFTVHSAMVYVIQVCRQLSSCSCSKAVCTVPVWHITLLSVRWINCWWWTDELSETRTVSWQNKFVKLLHLVGFITKKLVTMRGHMNVKFYLHMFRSILAVLREKICIWQYWPKHRAKNLCTVLHYFILYRSFIVLS
jgi:hypothetical protein